MQSPKGKSRKAKSSGTQQGPGKKAMPKEEALWADIKHFKPSEFTCKCQGLCDHPNAISPELVAKLDRIRDLIGMPLIISSGTRCERYNQQVGGKRGSAHVPREAVSHAADIYCPDTGFRFAFLVAALPMFNRIGMGKDFIHVDDDPQHPPNLIWVY